MNPIKKIALPLFYLLSPLPALGEDGWNFHAMDEAGHAGHIQYGEENYGAFGFGNYKNLKVNALFAKTKQDNWGNRTLWKLSLV
jgi:hypothetical protein